MNSLIIGAGEVGIALSKVIGGEIIDKEFVIAFSGSIPPEPKQYGIIHICFPYSDKFVGQVKSYQKQYKPIHTVIHSTVPVGTSTKCKAYHSPIRGVHPYLDKGIKTFVKYLAPKNQELKEYFEKAGIKIKLIDKPENTEALKLWSTTQFKRFIELEKEIYAWCEENGLDFDVIYTEANRTYNEGYEKLGMGHVRRPILKHMKGLIGGHCLLSNYKLLGLKERLRKPWTEEELRIIIDYNKEGLTFKEISEKMENRTYNAIRNAAYKTLEIKSTYNPAITSQETRQKISASLQGIEIEEWNGFKETVNSLIRKSVKYQEWRKKVFEKDNYTCQDCGAKSEVGKDVYLEAHHIKSFAEYPELRFEVSNGRTLCKKCHIIKL